MSDKSQKTEKPTPQRKREAVREGRIARSADVSAWLTVLAVSYLLPVTVRHTRELFDTLMGRLQDVIVHPDPQVATGLLGSAVVGMLGALAPLLLTSVAVALLGNVVQGGLRVSSKQFKPKWEHLNIVKGVKRMVGAQAAWSLAKSLLKLGALGLVAWVVLKGVVAQFTGTAWSVTTAMAGAAGAALQMLRVVAVVGLVIAAADYLVERRRLGRSLMMSREEVKREARQSEGDPHQKGARISRQREMSRNRMIGNVRDADVVMVNPTHVAVALKYESGRGAPRVVAKGAGAVAARIREEAVAHRLPMVEDVPLARALYAACEVGEEIPLTLYDAVARVLAFVMSLRLRGSVAGVHRSPVPQGLVPTP